MIAAVLQARTSSRRLPGKVLMPVLGRPMLARQIERLRRVGRMKLVVATSEDASDDPIEALCEGEQVACHRGSLEDVLARVNGAAERFEALHVVRLTGDCPLADPGLIEKVIAHHVDGGFDYTSNALERSYPDGLDVEVVRADVLACADREATLPSHREHVTPFVYQQPERFRLGSVRDAVDRSALRWVVDEARDLEFARRVYQALYPGKPDFGCEDVLALLEREPALAQINGDIDPNEGWERSLRRDQAFVAEGA